MEINSETVVNILFLIIRLIVVLNIIIHITKKLILDNFYRLNIKNLQGDEAKPMYNFLSLSLKENRYGIGYWCSLVLGIVVSNISNNNFLVLLCFVFFIYFLWQRDKLESGKLKILLKN